LQQLDAPHCGMGIELWLEHGLDEWRKLGRGHTEH
jgi:hypothetical protein